MDNPGVPLPTTHDKLQGPPGALAAYARLLPLQSRHPIQIRLCGWMIIHAPSPAGRDYVATCINRCESEEAIVAVGEGYKTYFIGYFRAALRKPTPTPSTHPSRKSLDELRNEILSSIQEAPKDHRDAKKWSLVRDNYRCMLSGHVDRKSFANIPALRTSGVGVAPTQCCHILPQHLNQNISNPGKLEASASAWTVLQCFGGIAPEELNGPAMHRLDNILTMKSDYHETFDSLGIWLDPIEGTEDQYEVGKAYPQYHPELPPTVTFKTDYPQLPLPDRRYLALHAACAKVAHMSGAGHLIDQILDEMADTKVLSEDGSSGVLLGYLLSAETLLAH